jgi:SSS family solute:Na+ symporter
MDVTHLNYLDWIVFCLILFMTVATVMYAHQKQEAAKTSWADRLVLGRQLTMPLFIGTLGSTWYGGIFWNSRNRLQ